MKSIYILAAILLAFLLSFHKTALGQTNPLAFHISGTVADSVTNKPLDFITLNLMADKNTALKTDFTKTDGSFVFAGLKPMKYIIVVVALGYQTKTFEADLTDTTRKHLDLGTIFIRTQSIGLKEIVVTAAKQVVRQEIDRITYDTQADPESKVYNVLEMMRKVPFLSLDAENNILLKGNTDFKILINGKPSSMVERSYKDILRSMPASSIQRIEVITTPPSKYDAEGLGGIINIITNKNVDNGYNGSLNMSERFPMGGPGIGGAFSAKIGKFGMSAFGGASIYNTPATNSSISRATYGTDPTDLFQYARNRSDSRSGYIGYELTYEIDSLNLISGQFNLNGNRSSGSGTQQSLLNGNGEILQGYNLDNQSNGNGHGMDAALNYQRGFKADKSRLLTFSYRYFNFGNIQNNEIAVSERVNYDMPDYHQANDQRFAEQTLQVDLVYPVKKLNIEAGLKGILRDNKSDFQYQTFSEATGNYEIYPGLSNRFQNSQNVFGAYNTYQYSFKKWGLKAGVRVEQTVIKADFISTDSRVRQNYFNVIPSVSVNRNLKNNTSVNLGYTQRIQRPGIYQLNPFVDRSNPSFERTGNPDLRPAVVNDIQIGYSRSKKVSFNGGPGYTFFRDLIFPVAVYDPQTKITRTSYGNTGTAKLLSGNMNINYPVNKKLNLSLNARLAHGWVKGIVNGSLIKNSGFMYNISASAGYRFEKDWRVNANLNINGPNVGLQGTSNSMVGSSFSFSKDIVKDKLSLSASANNPFTKYRTSHNVSFGPNFNQVNDRRDYFRSYNLSVNYKFGKLKESIRKNKRGIRNDDVSNGN